MLKQLLYNRGLVLLPKPFVKTLYILDRTKKYKKNYQTLFLSSHIGYQTVNNKLNSVRERLLRNNFINKENEYKKVLEQMKNIGILYEENETILIDYSMDIERIYEIDPKSMSELKIIRNNYRKEYKNNNALINEDIFNEKKIINVEKSNMNAFSC